MLSEAEPIACENISSKYPCVAHAGIVGWRSGREIKWHHVISWRVEKYIMKVVKKQGDLLAWEGAVNGIAHDS